MSLRDRDLVTHAADAGPAVRSTYTRCAREACHHFLLYHKPGGAQRCERRAPSPRATGGYGWGPPCRCPAFLAPEEVA